MAPKPSKQKPAAKSAAEVAAAAAAELAKECDKALLAVVSNPSKAKKEVAKLLERAACSLTYRAQSALHLMMALLEAGSEAKHLLQALAVAEKGASAQPACLHLRLARARAHIRLAEAVTEAARCAKGVPLAEAGNAVVPSFDDAKRFWEGASAAVDALEAEGTAEGEILFQERRMERLLDVSTATIKAKFMEMALERCACFCSAVTRRRRRQARANKRRAAPLGGSTAFAY
jgi:hypothetical protein